MNQLEIEIILRYIEEYLPELENTFDKDALEERSYSRWTAYEIVNRLMDYPFDPPDMIVESFILELTGYSHITKGEKANHMLSIAISAADDVLCLLT